MTEYELTPLDGYVRAVVDALIRHGIAVREHWADFDDGDDPSAGIDLALTVPGADGRGYRSVLRWDAESGWRAGQVPTSGDVVFQEWRYFVIGRVPHPADVVDGLGRWIADPRQFPDSAPRYEDVGGLLDRLLAAYDLQRQRKDAEQDECPVTEPMDDEHPAVTGDRTAEPMSDERLAQIRAAAGRAAEQMEGDGSSMDACVEAVPWLLEQLAARNTEVKRLRAVLKELGITDDQVLDASRRIAARRRGAGASMREGSHA